MLQHVRTAIMWENIDLMSFQGIKYWQSHTVDIA